MKQIMEEKAQNYKNGKINYVTEKVVKDSTITLTINNEIIDVHIMVGVLDGRHTLAARAQRGDQLFQQGRLAHAGVSGKAQSFHGVRFLFQ